MVIIALYWWKYSASDGRKYIKRFIYWEWKKNLKWAQNVKNIYWSCFWREVSYLSPETLHCGQHLQGWQPQILGLTLQTAWEISDWLLKSYLTVRYLFLKSRDSLCWRQNRNTRMNPPCPVFRSQFSSIWPECEKWGKRSKAGSCRIRYFCNTCRIRTQNILHRPLSPTLAFYFLLCLKLECLDIC